MKESLNLLEFTQPICSKTQNPCYETMSVYMSNYLNSFIQNTDSFYKWVIESIA